MSGHTEAQHADYPAADMGGWAEAHRLVAECTKLRAERDSLIAERDAWHNRAEALEKLAAHYRIGSRPSEKLLVELERARRAVDALDAPEDAGNSSVIT